MEPKPVSGKYKFIAPFKISFCSESQGGNGIVALCKTTREISFKIGDIINLSGWGFDGNAYDGSGNIIHPGTNQWQATYSENGANNIPIPSSVLMKVSDSDQITTPVIVENAGIGNNSVPKNATQTKKKPPAVTVFLIIFAIIATITMWRHQDTSMKFALGFALLLIAYFYYKSYIE